MKKPPQRGILRNSDVQITSELTYNEQTFPITEFFPSSPPSVQIKQESKSKEADTSSRISEERRPESKEVVISSQPFQSRVDIGGSIAPKSRRPQRPQRSKEPEIQPMPTLVESRPPESSENLDYLQSGFDRIRSIDFDRIRNIDFSVDWSTQENAKKFQNFVDDFEKLNELITKNGDHFLKKYDEFLIYFKEYKKMPYFHSPYTKWSCFKRRWPQAYYKIMRCLGDNQSQINSDLMQNILDAITTLEKKLVYVRYLSFLQFIKYHQYSTLIGTGTSQVDQASKKFKNKFKNYFVQACHFIRDYHKNFENYQIKLTPDEIKAFKYSLNQFAEKFGSQRTLEYKEAFASINILSDSVFNRSKNDLESIHQLADQVRNYGEAMTTSELRDLTQQQDRLVKIRSPHQPTHFLDEDHSFNLLRKIVYKSLDNKETFLRYEPQLKLQAFKDYITLYNYYYEKKLCQYDNNISRVAEYVSAHSPHKTSNLQQSKSLFGRFKRVSSCIKTCGQSLNRTDQQPDGYEDFADKFKQDDQEEVKSKWSSCFKSKTKITDSETPKPEIDLLEKLANQEEKILVSYDYFKSQNLLDTVNLTDYNSKFKELAMIFGYEEQEVSSPIIYQATDNTYIPYPANFGIRQSYIDDDEREFLRSYEGVNQPRSTKLASQPIAEGSLIMI